MRQAIRVYAIVALVVLGAFLALEWASSFGITNQIGWMGVFGLMVVAQLWVLLVIPLGVLAASDAARMGRHGLLEAFIVLLVLAPFAASVDVLATDIQHLLNPTCGFCVFGAPSLFQAGLAAAFLPIPLVALISTVAPARKAPQFQADGSDELGADRAHADAGQGEQRVRRVITVWAIIGLVVLGALSYLGNSDFIMMRFGSGTIEHIEFVGDLRSLVYGLWFALHNALPVAVVSLAMISAARAGRRGWLAAWIVVGALAMLATNLLGLITTLLAFTGPPSPTDSGLVAFVWQLGSSQLAQMQTLSEVVPLVVLLLALLYALILMRPQTRQGGHVAAAPADA